MALRISSTTCCTALPASSPSLPPSYDNKTSGTCPSVRVFSPRSVRVCRHQHQQGLCFHVRHKGASIRARTQCLMEARLGRTGGAGVLERPGLDQSQPSREPRVEEGGDMGKLSQRHIYGGGDRYRVLLLDHERHTEAQVASVLPKVVPSLTANEARKCFQISREKGVGIVTITVKEHAEFYAQMMARCGLRSGIEPDGDTI